VVCFQKLFRASGSCKARPWPAAICVRHSKIVALYLEHYYSVRLFGLCAVMIPIKNQKLLGMGSEGKAGSTAYTPREVDRFNEWILELHRRVRYCMHDIFHRSTSISALAMHNTSIL
jgi:hypothetical protein